MRLIAKITGCAGVALLSAQWAGAALADQAWYPLTVDAIKLDGTKGKFEYTPLSATGKASKDWNICVSFPHLKDPAFVALNYGMTEEAKLLGVSIHTMDAGGYTGLSTQISQIEDCVAG